MPFRTGPQIMPDLIAGRVHIYVSPTLAVLPLHYSKELKVIGITSPERLASAKDIPTLTELNSRLASIIALPEYKEMIEKGGSIPGASSPAELGNIIIQTRDEVASTIQEFGLQQD